MVGSSELKLGDWIVNDPQDERWAPVVPGLENLGFSGREIKKLLSGPARAVAAIAMLGTLAAACKPLEQPTPESTSTVPPTVRPTDIPTAPTAKFTPEPTATSYPRPETSVYGVGGGGELFDQASMDRFEQKVLSSLEIETGLSREEIQRGTALLVQAGDQNAYIFLYGETVCHFFQNQDGGYTLRRFSEVIDGTGLEQSAGEQGKLEWKDKNGETVFEVSYIGIGNLTELRMVKLVDAKTGEVGLYWQLDDHFLPLKGMFDYDRLADGYLAVENPATLTIEIRTLAGDLVVGIFDPLAGKAGEWVKQPGNEVWIPVPTATPEIKPVKMGQIILEDQSKRMDIKWKDENSMAKVQEAFLIMWARKAGTTPEAIKAKMAKGEKVTGFATYLVFDENGHTVNTVTQKVDLSKPAKIVVWDNSVGLGSDGNVRIQLSVNKEGLTVFIYLADDFIREMSTVSGLREALKQLYNNGKPVSHDDPVYPRTEAMDAEVRPFLVDESTSVRLPEIKTLPQ